MTKKKGLMHYYHVYSQIKKQKMLFNVTEKKTEDEKLNKKTIK
jgi:hypothetical protein